MWAVRVMVLLFERGRGTTAIVGNGCIAHLAVGDGVGRAVDEKAAESVVLLVEEYTEDEMLAVVEGEYTEGVAVGGKELQVRAL